MQTLDPAGEWLPLSERYRQLSDDALVGVARQTSKLTDVAQQVLAQEVANRRLKTHPKNRRLRSVPSRSQTLFADALKLQRLLDTAGIPFFMGPEKATRVEAVTSNFPNGLGVQIMQVGLPWARPVLQHYFPADEPPQEQADEPDNFAMHCPKCHSTEVVFEDLDHGPENPEGKPSSKFKWTCDSCGHEWEDDGLLTAD